MKVGDIVAVKEDEVRRDLGMPEFPYWKIMQVGLNFQSVSVTPLIADGVDSVHSGEWFDLLYLKELRVVSPLELLARESQ